MTKARTKRNKKQQMGQFMTPLDLSMSVIKNNNYNIESKILEPSFGEGSFILNQIDLISKNVYNEKIPSKEVVIQILKNNIFGYEYDEDLYNKCILNIKERYLLDDFEHNLIFGDFLISEYELNDFNFIDGNPPFGGTINSEYNEKLDKKYGKINGLKIKKETYSFFVVKSLDLLCDNGEMTFICSDTFKTINTMKGLRQVMLQHTVYVDNLNYFSEETTYGMVVIKIIKNNIPKLFINKKEIKLELVNKTPNFSFEIEDDLIKYFQGKFIKDYVSCSGGLTTGKNEYFVREIKDNKIIEEYDFNFYQKKLTLNDEISKAKHNFLSKVKENEYIEKEKNNFTYEDVNIIKKKKGIEIEIPNNDYYYFNRSVSDVLYSKPTHVIYWKDYGKAVITFKKNGNWYLNGVGGKQFYYKEGFTWSLISSKINPRYLPPNYVLDNSSMVGILKEGIEKNELYFIIAWLCTDVCNNILKKVINHTRNIQSKDIERLPYPFWVNHDKKIIIIDKTIKAIKNKIDNNILSTKYFDEMNKLFIL